MSVLIFANDFSTTLASPITNSATSMTLLSTSGIPAISGDEYFKLTIKDASTGLIKEIVDCTAVVGNVVTIVRGAEGTSPAAWSAGDNVSNNWTAGSAAAMQQTAESQAQTANYCATPTGTANAIVAVFSPPITSHSPGTPLRVKIATVNTGAVTFNPGPSAVAVIAPNGSALQAGDLPAGEIVEFKYDGANYQVEVVGTNASRPGVVELATNAETIAGTDATRAVTPASGASAYATLGSLASANAAIAALQALQATGVLSANGYLRIPISGVGTAIVQWGTTSFTPGAIAYYNQMINFPIAFPNTPFAIVATAGTTFNGGDGATGGVIDVVMIPASGITAAHFVAHGDTNASQTLSGVHTIRWIAIGF